jgi:hypothetical protein
MDYRIIRYRPRYRDDVLQLQTHLWGSDLRVNSNYLTWKYEENPYLDEPLIYLALHDDRVVGMRGLWGANWEIGSTDQTIVMPCAGDTTISPEHRKRGLLRQIFRFIMDDPAVAAFPYILNFSAGESVYHSQIGENWRVIAPYGTVSRAPAIVKSTPFRILQRLTQRVASRSFRKKLLINAGRLERAGGMVDQVQLSESPRPGDMASLVERMGRPDRIHHVRDQRYFAWRFRSPLAGYRFFYWKDTALDGFLVVARNLHSIAPASVVDWEAVNQDVLSDLLLAAIGQAGLGGIAIWKAALPKSVVDLLDRLGFTALDTYSADREYRPAFLATCVDKAMVDTQWTLAGQSLTDLKSWDLRMVNSDSH